MGRSLFRGTCPHSAQPNLRRRRAGVGRVRRRPTSSEASVVVRWEVATIAGAGPFLGRRGGRVATDAGAARQDGLAVRVGVAGADAGLGLAGAAGLEAIGRGHAALVAEAIQSCWRAGVATNAGALAREAAIRGRVASHDGAVAARLVEVLAERGHVEGDETGRGRGR